MRIPGTRYLIPNNLNLSPSNGEPDARTTNSLPVVVEGTGGGASAAAHAQTYPPVHPHPNLPPSRGKEKTAVTTVSEDNRVVPFPTPRLRTDMPAPQPKAGQPQPKTVLDDPVIARYWAQRAEIIGTIVFLMLQTPKYRHALDGQTCPSELAWFLSARAESWTLGEHYKPRSLLSAAGLRVWPRPIFWRRPGCR